jgi:hypothetical protein
MKVFDRKTVIISQNLVTNAPFTADFSTVYFEPDELIVRGISLTQTAGATNHMLITSTLTDNYPMINFSRGDTVTSIVPNFNSCELHFMLRRPVRGLHTFTITDPNGAIADFQGQIGLHLEFVKY